MNAYGRALISSAASDFHARRNSQVGLVNPSASIGSTVPALKGDGTDVFPIFVIENFTERSRKSGPHLSGRAADEEQAIFTIVEQGHGPPTLGLRFGGVKHGSTLLGLSKGRGLPKGAQISVSSQEQSEALAATIDNAPFP